nr:hypothetical protein [uncultured Roseateles sp.]
MKDHEVFALQFLARDGGARYATWRNAGISAAAMNSLHAQGRVDWFEDPFGGVKYVVTDTGRAAIAAAGR